MSATSPCKKTPKPTSISVRIKRLRDELEKEFVKNEDGTANNLTINGEIIADLEAVTSLLDILGIGDKEQLETENKDTLVDAINEVLSLTNGGQDVIVVNNLGGEPRFNALPLTENPNP